MWMWIRKSELLVHPGFNNCHFSRLPFWDTSHSQRHICGITSSTWAHMRASLWNLHSHSSCKKQHICILSTYTWAAFLLYPVSRPRLCLLWLGVCLASWEDKWTHLALVLDSCFCHVWTRISFLRGERENLWKILLCLWTWVGQEVDYSCPFLRAKAATDLSPTHLSNLKPSNSIFVALTLTAPKGSTLDWRVASLHFPCYRSWPPNGWIAITSPASASRSQVHLMITSL